MRKFPASHYPVEAVQHKRAALALGLCNVLLIARGRGGGGALPRIAAKIGQCAAQTRARRLSSSFHRAANKAIDIIYEFINAPAAGAGPDESEQERRWLVCAWACLTQLEDMRYTCPLYYDSNPAWRYLLQMFARLVEKELARHPDADIDGTALYERLFDAISASD